MKELLLKTDLFFSVGNHYAFDISVIYRIIHILIFRMVAAQRPVDCYCNNISDQLSHLPFQRWAKTTHEAKYKRMNITKLSAQLINPKNQSLKRVSLMLLVINEKTIPMIERIGTKKSRAMTALLLLKALHR